MTESSSILRSRGKMIPTHSQSSTKAEATSTPTSRGITEFTISVPGSSIRTVNATEPSPPRWRTTEFSFYGVAFLLVVPLLVWWPIRLSLPSHPNYPLFAHRLSPGWLFGRPVDASDPQYRSFRNNLPALLILASSYLSLSTLQSHLWPTPRSRSIFITLFSLAMLLVLHGLSALKILAILSLSYFASISTKTPAVGKAWPAILVAGNMGILLLNEQYDGYKLGSLHAVLQPLDTLGGLLPRWHVSFNITMLRMVSFGLDYHWRQSSAAQEVPSDYRERVTTSLSDDEYNFLNYFAYCLYPPLYIAGPIITFNDFVWQLRQPVAITRRDQLSYLLRFVLCLLTMESVLHTMYVVAIKDTSAWNGDGPADLSMIGFWNLVVVWLKLLIPWRFLRLWALLDGVDPPENMIRCVADNYSTLGFWRSWHRSYNLWVVRYIYIPVGGSKNLVLGTILVFTFVALWHDLSFKLLAWGWLISFFILPELVAKRLVSSEKYGDRSWYRHVAAVGGVCNNLMMMMANLVGFVLGWDGTKHLLRELTGTASGWLFTAFASGCLFIAVQVMFEYREEERRKGIDRRC